MREDTFVAIMAGGIGSRFWPLSREEKPKQFLDLLGTGKSLLQMTFNRFAKRFNSDHIYIITSEQYIDDITNQLPDISAHQIIAEPQRKNTAPCILNAAFQLQKLNSNAKMIVTPADHFIVEQDDFLDSIEKGLFFVSKHTEALLTLGIKPTKPHTGYGYIQYLEGEDEIKKVKTFTEKPSVDFAKQFLDSGDFLWNSGIFIWTIPGILQSFSQHLSDMFLRFQEVDYHSDSFKDQLKRAYSLTQNISIDYGIMEKEDNVYVLPSFFSWSDLGTWDALFELQASNEQDNVTNCTRHIIKKSHNNIAHIQKKDKLLVLQDVDGLIIVDADDALVICNKNSEQKLKEIVHSITAKNWLEYL